MSAHLILRATVDVGEQYTVQHSIRICTMAYPVQTLEVVMANSTYKVYWPMTGTHVVRLCGTGMTLRASAHPTAVVFRHRRAIRQVVKSDQRVC